MPGEATKRPVKALRRRSATAAALSALLAPGCSSTAPTERPAGRTRRLEHLPMGAEVTAAYQPAGRTDPHGRDLWDMWLPDGRFLQALLVASGAAEARAYPPHNGHAEHLDELERIARRQGKGLHGGCR